MKILKNWKMLLLIFTILLAVGIILTQGIPLGLDFGGGTRFEIELQEKISQEEISRMSNIISMRIDPTGLRDYTIFPVGGQYITIQMSETDPIELEKIESRIRQQGKFEANLNGEIVFTGDEIRSVLRGTNSYGIIKISKTNYEWSLPFVLNEKAVKSFTEKTFHQCTITGYDTSGKPSYDCEKTIFFLDKPDAVILTSRDYYEEDEEALFLGNRLLNIPIKTEIDEVIEDSLLSVIILDENLDLELLQNLYNSNKKIIVSNDINDSIITQLTNIGFEVEIREKLDKPWLWDVLNAKQIISLTSGITNETASDLSQAEQFSTLRISGQRETDKEAFHDLEELAILLESGSLPTPVKSISKEIISPTLGQSFLSTVMLMGIVAFILVGIVLTIRYRIPKIVIPIYIIGISEILIMLGFIAFFKRPLDLAAFAGIIVSIGTGVDSEIVITDELLSRDKVVKESLISRVKSALFILMTSALTMIGVMGPIIIFRSSLLGLDKLYGFAIVAIVGSLIGLIVTRPAFTLIMEQIVKQLEKK